MYYSDFNSPIGSIALLSDGNALCGLHFEDKSKARRASFKTPEKNASDIFEAAKRFLTSYFSGGNPDLKSLPLKLSGTEFQIKILRCISEIPYGEVAGYGEIAKIAAADSETGKMSAQAVGNAIGKNPIAVIVPCHRVIGSDGSLTGYAGGLHRKLELLRLENADDAKCFFFSKAELPAKFYENFD